MGRPIQSYLPYEDRPAAQAAIDAGARDTGRDPSDVLRIAQLVGTVTEAPHPPAHHPGGCARQRADPGQRQSVGPS